MAIANFCGFEAGDFSEAISTGGSGTVSIESSSPLAGDYSAKIDCTADGTHTGFVTIPARDSTGLRGSWGVATGYYLFNIKLSTIPATASTEEEICRVVDPSQNLKMLLRITDGGIIKAYDSTSTLMATGSTSLTEGSTYAIGLSCGNGTSAAWAVEIDGVSEISGSTDNLRATNNGYLVLGKSASLDDEPVLFLFDDVIFDTAAIPTPGPTVRRMDVDGAGTYTDFAAGAGAGDYTDLDEVPHDEATSYLVGQAANDAETTSHESTSSAGISGTIDSVICGCVSKRSGGTNGALRITRRLNSTDYTSGSDASTNANWRDFGIVDNVSPDTSVAWTLSELDSIEVGMVNRSTPNDSDLTQVRLFVLFTLSGDPEGPLIGGKLVGGGILMQGRLVG